MIPAERARLIATINMEINRAKEHAAYLGLCQAHLGQTQAASILASGWEQVAQVWREAKAKVEDGRP
jgi:NADH:ubiquinone oxidoreductase subunit D